MASSLNANLNQPSLRIRNHKPTRAAVKMMPIGTPRVPYRTPGEGTWQWVDIWNALYRERILFIGQNIDEEFSNQILATMLYLDTIDDSKRMYLYINGPGGDLTPSLAIYDTMQSLKSPVGTHCVGFAYNLAGFLLTAGEKTKTTPKFTPAITHLVIVKSRQLKCGIVWGSDSSTYEFASFMSFLWCTLYDSFSVSKGNRSAMPLSRIALQSPAGAARGQADDICNEANELLRIRDYLYNELSKKTGQPFEKISKDLSRMKRFEAQDALEYGLIDRIIRPPRIDADLGPSDASAGLG
ncbi:hypothetical protein POTOM_004490 [Populus tomentosa]|uniref:ATP-dependent Clp protease proteolytic subunit n=1 Tax=Populus tomentosa TaxID=118781 RepID=A0A8X8DD94_POPTO|nr:hypothetical protein POTOM_004490 [Populus tomentosa]